MIIQVNDAFGVGKTQTCNELHRRIQNSFFFDAENAGYFIGSYPYVSQDNFEDELNKFAEDGWRIKDIKITEKKSIFNSNNTIIVFMEKNEENQVSSGNTKYFHNYDVESKA